MVHVSATLSTSIMVLTWSYKIRDMGPGEERGRTLGHVPVGGITLEASPIAPREREGGRKGGTEREKEREGERERKKERQRERDTYIELEKERQTERKRERESSAREKEREREIAVRNLNHRNVESIAQSCGAPWRRYDTPIPGWMLPVIWHTDEGLPHKGIMACTHARKPGSLRLNWMLRVALAQVTSCYELLILVGG